MKRLKELEESGAKSTHIDDGRNTELVPRESWELVNREKKELEDTVKQKEKRLLRLQQVYLTKYLTIYFNRIIYIYIYRCLPPKVPNSEKPSRLSWESNWLFTQTDKCALLPCMTSVLLLFSNPRRKTKALGCNLWLKATVVHRIYRT